MDDFELVDHYQVLGVPRDASPGEIDQAYRAAMLREHPDRSAHPQANERASRVNEAGRVLMDPELRRQYDPDADIRQRRDRVGLQHLAPLGEEDDGSYAGGTEPASRGGAQGDADRYASVTRTSGRSHQVDQRSVSRKRVWRPVVVGGIAVAALVAAALVYLFVLQSDNEMNGGLNQATHEVAGTEDVEDQSGQSNASPGGSGQGGQVDSTAASAQGTGLRLVRGDGYQLLEGLELVSISTGVFHSCGLGTTGQVVCWGGNYEGNTDAPAGRFIQVSAGGEHSCAVDADGEVVCWGDNGEGQTDAPSGRFSQVSAGEFHSCAVDVNGRAVCWGDNREGQAEAPPGQFTQISAGFWHSCALGADASVVCWGRGYFDQFDQPEGRFSQVSAGEEYSCALSTNGYVVCWEGPYWHESLEDEDTPEGRFSQVSAGHYYGCAIALDGGVVCWGENEEGQANAPTGRFSEVSAGEFNTCAIAVGGGVACWGESQFANLHVAGERVTIEEAASEIVVRQRDQSDTNAEDQSTHSLAEQTQESDAEGEREATEPNTEPDIDQRVPARESNGNNEQATVANKTAELEPDSQEDRSTGGLEEDDGDSMEDASDGLMEGDGDGMIDASDDESMEDASDDESMEDASDGLMEGDGDGMIDASDDESMEDDGDGSMEDDGPSLSDLTSLSGLAVYTGPDTIASELMLLLGGRATSIGLWDGSRWVFFGVVDGMLVPGSADFSVIEGDVLSIAN